jgi:hypothetical protein
MPNESATFCFFTDTDYDIEDQVRRNRALARQNQPPYMPSDSLPRDVQEPKLHVSLRFLISHQYFPDHHQHGSAPAVILSGPWPGKPEASEAPDIDRSVAGLARDVEGAGPCHGGTGGKAGA